MVDATEDLIIHHLRQHFRPQHKSSPILQINPNQPKLANNRRKGTTSIDYREYPIETSDTLRHYSELCSLPTLYDEVFPVRGGPTCIPRCAPYDDGLFLIAHVINGDVLFPVHGTNIPIKRVKDGKYRSPYLVQDDRSQTIIDMADYRCGYARLANDIYS